MTSDVPDESMPKEELRGWAYARMRMKAWAEFGVSATLAGAVLFALIRLYPGPTPYPLGTVESEAHWVVFAAVLATFGAWRLQAKRRGIALALTLVVLVPWYFEWIPTWLTAPATPTHPTAHLRVMSTNLLSPRPSSVLAREILESDADVVLVQEASDVWWSLLEREGVLARYPHHVEEVHSIRDDYMGIAILSRLPIEASRIQPLVEDYVPVAYIDVRVAGQLLRLYSVHTTPPSRAQSLATNRAQFDQVERMAREDMESGAFHAVIFAGDFNGTPTSHSYRMLRNAGFIAAHERVGRGYATTWPRAEFLAPPMRLDHFFFLEREAGNTHVLSVREGESGRSDHAPLLVELAFTEAATHG